MEFLVMDHRSVYHGVLGLAVLKELLADTSIHHLCMKFPTERGIATIRGDQISLRKWYLSSLWKFEPRSMNMILLDTKKVDMPVEGSTPEEGGDVETIDTLTEEAIPEQGMMEIILDPRIIEPESQASLAEKLKFFPIDPQDPTKTLMVGKELRFEGKQRLNDVLLKILDVFT